MTTQPKTSARLFVLLAREAPVGVILRHGPRDWVQMIRWDTQNDVFTSGQWFHGRIYDRRCDVSPDGSLIIYFAAKFSQPSRPPHSYRIWTAISKPPYFTALHFHPDYDTYGGGGLFLDDHTALYNRTSSGEGILSKPHARLKLVSESKIYTQEALCYRRLELGGWTSEDNAPYEHGDLWVNANLPGLWHKEGGNYRLSLTFGKRSLHYTIAHLKRGQKLSLERATWADIDQRGRVVIVRDGKILYARISHMGQLELIEVSDFNANKPEPIEAPDWAKKW